MSHYDEEVVEQENEPEYDDLPLGDEEELDETSAEFVRDLTLKVLEFIQVFCDVEFRKYQLPVAYSIVESVILGDGAEKTVIMSRQVGKTQLVAMCIAGMMVILPRLAKVYPFWLKKFEKGFLAGIFAPVDDQANTAFGRVISFLDNDYVRENFYSDPDLYDELGKPSGSASKGKSQQLKRCKSLITMQTANPRAKIEGKTYHFIYVDEMQDVDDRVYGKSIRPMTSSVNGTVVLTGTAQTYKCYFLEAINRNRRDDTNRRNRRRKDHFEVKWMEAAKENKDYEKYVKGEMLKLGVDSVEFRTSYLCEWVLEKGMFIDDTRLQSLYDPGMELQHSWWASKVVAGIDVARSNDSTVVTVMWVDWDNPDPFGFYEHRILDWLEINNVEWEQQYFRIIDFLRNYRVARVGVDSQGMGNPVAERLELLLEPYGIEVIAVPSNHKDQAERWAHLTQLIQRELFFVPGHSKARRTRRWAKFNQQMSDLEKVQRGAYMLAAAPEERGAYDDYADSAAIAAWMSVVESDEASDVVVMNNPFYSGRR